ncbi:MAG: zf-HC2 domain-containing protein [Treponemataceae bacterium]|nr:zf-HC2 domain-containing protein [Treponemataceae bacterium]
MCPDKSLLSLYMDGELPSPWKEKLETHLLHCEACQIEAKKLQRLHQKLHTLPSPPMEVVQTAQKRVWQQVAVKIKEGEGKPHKYRFTWNRPIAIPLPAAIAALILVALVASLAGPLLFSPENSTGYVPVARINTEVQNIVPVSNIENLVQYLEMQAATADIVIIKLPETQNFVPAGQPTLLKAVEYQGRKRP